MNLKPGARVLLAASAAVLLIVLIVVLLNRTSDPVHAGRPVSAWFADLCSGVFGGSPKAKGFEAAYAEFTRMGPEAIPYLTNQLRYDKSGIRQKVINRLRQYPTTKRYVTGIIEPLERRCYAAVALRQMGPKAEAAIPALLESWTCDKLEVKINVAKALESILYGTNTLSALPGQPQRDVVGEAGRRYPAVAAKLGIKIGPSQ